MRDLIKSFVERADWPDLIWVTVLASDRTKQLLGRIGPAKAESAISRETLPSLSANISSERNNGTRQDGGDGAEGTAMGAPVRAMAKTVARPARPEDKSGQPSPPDKSRLRRL